MVNTLVCMVTHSIRPTMNYDAKVSIIMIYQAIILHGLSTLRGY